MGKMRAIVFGATFSAMNLYRCISQRYEIIAYCDNDRNKWGSKIDGIPVIAPQNIFEREWDDIVITSFSSMNVIKEQLVAGGVPEIRINTTYVDYQIRARKTFISDFAKLIYELQIPGCVAEAGVFQGEFARVINEFFPDRILYLFDTFEGFDEKDIVLEQENGYSAAKPGYLNITSEEIVLNKMKFPFNCRIKKGYFPETAIGIEDMFCFVNLDMDLYKPTLEGLHFFWPQMEKGGIIMVYDYYSEGYKGVRAAVKEFVTQYGVIPFPIGDSISVALQKK